ncbi:hypothetical protein LUX57_48100 [Actinomadura madurae]|uniref:hypothetical protein n=1 Tax=Actinomadura madurae TaxID=1993 RepID=UPI0020D20E0E|nr:hypothetical protein [Actinomadura madurae]MCP9971892.1 hypothetical protein [Actinomadura madurae]
MEGVLRVAGEDTERPMRLELVATLPEVLRPWGDVEGELTGRVHIPGWADDRAAVGTLRVAPIAARRIRYTLEFTADDGRRMRLDGWKTVSARRPVRSMTVLPLTVTGADGTVAARRGCASTSGGTSCASSAASASRAPIRCGRAGGDRPGGWRSGTRR